MISEIPEKWSFSRTLLSEHIDWWNARFKSITAKIVEWMTVFSVK